MHQVVATGRRGICHTTLAQMQLLQSDGWFLGDGQRLQQQGQEIVAECSLAIAERLG
jgi:hypothetical protein